MGENARAISVRPGGTYTIFGIVRIVLLIPVMAGLTGLAN